MSVKHLYMVNSIWYGTKVSEFFSYYLLFSMTSSSCCHQHEKLIFPDFFLSLVGQAVLEDRVKKGGGSLQFCVSSHPPPPHPSHMNTVVSTFAPGDL